MLIWSRNFIWYLFSRISVGLILLVAVYASLGQYYAPMAGSYKTPILEFLNRNSPIELQAEQLTVSWRRLSPILELHGVSIRRDSDELDFIEVNKVSASVNVLASFRDRGVRLDHLNISGLELDLVENSRYLKDDRADVPWGELWLQFLSTLEYADMIVVEKSHLVTVVGEIDLFFELGRNQNFRRLNGDLVLNQAPLKFVIETNGSLVDAESLRGKAYFTAADVNFDRLGLDRVLTDNPIPADLSASTEVWLDWHPTRGISGQGSFSVPRLDLSKLLTNVGDVKNVKSNFLFSYQSPQQWDLSLSDTAFEFHEPFKQEALRVIMKREDEQPQLQVSAPLINLNLIHSVLTKVPALDDSRFVEVLDGLKPKGSVQALNVVVPINDYSATRFSGRLQQVGVSSWNQLPAGKNISGVIRGSAASGSLNLSSENFQLQLPKVYRNVLVYESMQGDFRWSTDADGFHLRSNRFSVSGVDGNISGFLGLHFPNKEDTSRLASMDLLVGLTGGQISRVETYLPYKLDTKLRQWLVDALPAGHVDSAAVLYRGAIAAGSDRIDRTLQMNYVVHDAELNYSPDWPSVQNIDAVVNVDDSKVDVALMQAVSEGVVLTDFTASTQPDQGFANWLAIEGNLTADTSAVLGFLLATPLEKTLGPIMADWRANGASAGRLFLGLPLSGEQSILEAYQLDIQLDVSGAELSLPTARLQFGDIDGVLSYRHDAGLTSEQLQGTFLGNAFSAAIHSNQLGTAWVPQVDVSGTLNVNALGQWLRTPIFDFVHGETPVSASVLTDEEGARLTFSSDLAGVKTDLPLPLKKQAEQRWPLTGELSLRRGEQTLQIDILDRLDVNAQLMDFAIQGVQVGINDSAAALPTLPGVYLTGNIDSLILDDWQPVVKHYANRQQADGPAMRMGVRQLHINDVDMFGYPLRDIDVFGDSILDFWHFFVDDDSVRGTAAVFSDGRPPRISLEHMDLAAFMSSTDSAVDVKSEQFWQQLNLEVIPSLDVSIEHLRRGEELLGSWAFDVRSQSESLALENIQVAYKDVVIEGGEDAVGAKFYWQRGDQPKTRLEGVFKLGDIASVMASLGMPATISSDSAMFDLQAEWVGLPSDFAAQNLSGKVGLEITQGMFLNVPNSATSALNISNLFNFGALVQRLKLDFSDLTSGGVRYDKVFGEVNFSEGMMDIVDTVEIEGPSSEFAISGGANLISSEVDFSLVAVLPLTGNISLITAATANLPAALGVFVVSKLFKKQFDKLSSVVYHITGPWDEPDIRFNKLFDVGELPSEKEIAR